MWAKVNGEKRVVSDEAKDLAEDATNVDETLGADAARAEAAREVAAVPDSPSEASDSAEVDAQEESLSDEQATAEPGEEATEEVEQEEEEQEEVEEEGQEEEEQEEEEAVHVPEPPAPVLTPEEEKAALAAQMDWYILKVQSNRENTIVDALRRRVAVEGLESYFGEVIVPVEMVTEFKGGKKKVVKRKLYPGYIVVEMVVTEDTWFLVRETPGVGDFTGAGGKPTPMSPADVEKIRPKVEADTSDAPRLKIDFKPGDKVKIIDGTFENFEGEVSAIDEASGRVTVMINIFGRSTPVELEYWQVEKI
jgi:transcriptional antiterminator NusG